MPSLKTTGGLMMIVAIVGLVLGIAVNVGLLFVMAAAIMLLPQTIIVAIAAGHAARAHDLADDRRQAPSK